MVAGDRKVKRRQDSCRDRMVQSDGIATGINIVSHCEVTNQWLEAKYEEQKNDRE